MLRRLTALALSFAAAAPPCGDDSDVAISAAFGLSWPQLRGLVTSFWHFAQPCATLALLVDAPVPAELGSALREHRVAVVPIVREWPYVQLPLPTAKLLELVPSHMTAPDSANRGSLVLLRHFLGEAWLEAERPQGHGRLLLVDSTDILFQADPFKAAPHDEVWVFEEHPWRTIGECEFNGGHLRAFGPLGEVVSRSTVVNSGVVLGSRGAVLRLVGAMRRLANEFRGQELNDQGILNYLTREPAGAVLRPREVRVVPHSDGPVRNVGPELFPSWRTYAPADVRLGLDADGWLAVLGADGVPAPILHQYNRNQRLSTALLERWEGGRLLHDNTVHPCRSVQELEVAFALQVHDAVDSLVTARPCESSGGCCRRRCWERRRKLLWASGSGSSVLTAASVLANLAQCASFGATASFVLNADLAGWVRAQGTDSLLQQLAARWDVFTARLQALEGVAKPWAFRRSWVTFFLCLDAACVAAKEAERAAAAWDVALAFLRAEAKNTPWVMKELEALGETGPGADWRRMWRVAWAADRKPAAVNESALARRLRFQRC